MKILIVGTKHKNWSEGRKRIFESACREIGCALVKAGHTLVVGSDSTNTAERFAVEGANMIGGKHEVTVIYRASDSSPFDKDSGTFAQINFNHHEVKDTWVVTRSQQIDAADGAVLIGGGQGTTAVGYQAPKQKKAVLPIPSFGGAARELWLEYERDYHRYGVATSDIDLLKGNWRPSSAVTIVKVIEQLIAYNLQLTERAPLDQEGPSSGLKEARAGNPTLKGARWGASNVQEEINQIRAQLQAYLRHTLEDQGTYNKEHISTLIERLVKLDESGIPNVRQLVDRALGDDDLNSLSFDYFRAVYDKISSNQGKAAKIQTLIEYCYRQEKFASLLEQIERKNRAKHVQFLNQWVLKGDPFDG